ncbi:MAG TPA: PAS domain S-box protein, partial [Polyangiaceae bacterium]|nr:PAS domain S-box protein [Polyangiaceae bacterium]
MQGALADSIDVFERLFTLSPDLMCTLDSNGRFELVNPSFSELGYRSVDLLAQSFVQFIHPDDREQVARLLTSPTPVSAPQVFHTRFRSNAGDYRHLAWSMVFSERSWFAVARDETHGHRVSEHVQDLNRFLDAIIENIPNMIFVKDAERLAFVRFNRAGEDLVGVNRHDLLGKTDFELFPEQEARFFQQKDRETLNGKVLVEIPEEPIATAQGERWLHTKKVPILDEQGTPKFLLGISEDISALKHTREQLAKSQEEAQALNRELESFSYSVAHDLRAPLRSMDGFSQAILEDYADKLDASGRKYLGYIRQSAQHMAQLIDDILTLSRVSRSNMAVEPTNLSQLAQRSLDQLRQSQPQRAVEIVVEENLCADADPRLLGILFDNLLENAWKFTKNRPVTRIHVGQLNGQAQPTFFI